MITLRKRLSVNNRVGSIKIFDISKITDDEVNYLISKLGKDIYQQIYQICNSFEYYWLGFDDQTSDYSIYPSYEDVMKEYKSFAMFTKQDRSSFKYWFAHWCGFQLTALNLGIWKFKYLLHDIEKPWLKLLWKGDYKKVQKWHRNHNNHHLEYGLKYGWDFIDWEALMIDWECCGLSKQEAQLDARETLEYEVNRDKWHKYENVIRDHLEPLLMKYNL